MRNFHNFADFVSEGVQERYAASVAFLMHGLCSPLRNDNRGAREEEEEMEGGCGVCHVVVVAVVAHCQFTE